jgi:uncharacterized protein
MKPGNHFKPRWRQGLLTFVVLVVAGVSVYAFGFRSSSGPRVDRTGYITISGGVKLAYDLTLPAATGRFPVALEYDHYSAGEDNSSSQTGSDANRLLEAGFAVLGVNEPGSGCSGGVNEVSNVNEWGRAGAQVVEWAAAQPWSTGHVGMFGSSWTGITQLGVASFRPRGLDAITPFHIVADIYRDAAYPGGIYNTFVNFYSAGLVKVDAQTAAGGIKHRDQQCIRDFRAHVPLNRKYILSRGALANPFDDAYWHTSPAEYLNRIDVPILGCQSWQDGAVGSRATELYYDTFKKKTSWFIGMNGFHGICEFSQPLTMMVNFMRHYVAGVNNGWQKSPHITIFHEVKATASSEPEPSWMSTYNSWSDVMKPVTLYFSGTGSLATSPVTTATGGRSSFSGPAPSQSGRWTKVPAAGSSVSYTAPKLTHSVDFFGPGSVDLWLSSTVHAPDIEVILSEVRPDGQDQYVQVGWLNLADRKLAPAGNGPAQSSVLRPYQLDTRASYEPLTPGKAVYARVELLPFEHVFRTGSSIQITIDSADGPVQSNGLWRLAGSKTPFRDTIYTSPAHDSQIVLGLIPGATANAPLPSCADIAGEPCRHNAARVPPGTLTIPGS